MAGSQGLSEHRYQSRSEYAGLYCKPVIASQSLLTKALLYVCPSQKSFRYSFVFDIIRLPVKNGTKNCTTAFPEFAGAKSYERLKFPLVALVAER